MTHDATRCGRRGAWGRAGMCVLVLGWFWLSSPAATAQMVLPNANWWVKITTPDPGSTVTGTIAAAANVHGKPLAVSGVLFLLDGAALGAEDTASPYMVAWDIRTTNDGPHLLTAIVRLSGDILHVSVPVTVTVSNTTPMNVRSEESAATLAPNAAWSSISSAVAGVDLSGGQAIYSATTGATATFSFTGTGVTWVGFPCEVCGTAQVRLDGSSVATIDTYAPIRPAASGSLYTASGLVSGSHTLVIEVTGTSNPSSGGVNVDVDAFDVEGVPPGVGGPGGGGIGSSALRIEENDPSVQYTGTWLTQDRSDLSGGSVVEANDPTRSATLTFDGTGVSWIGFKGPWAGIAQVYLDGALTATVDTYAPTEQAQALIYTAGGLVPGTHTLRIQVTGTWNDASVSAWIVIDAFDVLGV